MTTEDQYRMPEDRFNRIMHLETEELTPEDIANGWHFCVEMDGLLLNANDPDNDFCRCYAPIPDPEQEKTDSVALKENEYLIVTIADAFEKIPVDRVDAFLVDLGAAMKSKGKLEACLSSLAKDQIKLDLSQGFLWMDDGKNDMKFHIGSSVAIHSPLKVS